MDQAWKSITNGFIVLVKDLILQGNRQSHPWKLSITIEKEYIPLLN